MREGTGSQSYFTSASLGSSLIILFFTFSFFFFFVPMAGTIKFLTCWWHCGLKVSYLQLRLWLESWVQFVAAYKMSVKSCLIQTAHSIGTVYVSAVSCKTFYMWYDLYHLLFWLFLWLPSWITVTSDNFVSLCTNFISSIASQWNKGLNSVPIISTLAVVFSQVQAYHFSSLGMSGFCNRTNRLRPALVLVELHFLHSDERKLIIYYHCFP